jgi:hypothetical protein
MATLTEFETACEISRSCAIAPQIGATHVLVRELVKNQGVMRARKTVRVPIDGDVRSASSELGTALLLPARILILSRSNPSLHPSEGHIKRFLRCSFVVEVFLLQWLSPGGKRDQTVQFSHVANESLRQGSSAIAGPVL